MSGLELLQSENYWNSAWDTYFLHYQQDLRHAYYINAFLNDGEKVLEMGAGSFRDFACLNTLGCDCYGMDYCEQSVNQAQALFPDLANRIFRQNAFSTSFDDNFFDFTFHNGFWGCFEDSQILDLAKEQIRISKKRFSFTLHNKHNSNFVDYFIKLAKNDPLYSVRFFAMDDVYDLMDKLGISQENISIYPVGKGKKFHEDLLINENKLDRKTLYNTFTEAGMKHLNISERLLCIVKM